MLWWSHGLLLALFNNAWAIIQCIFLPECICGYMDLVRIVNSSKNFLVMSIPATPIYSSRYRCKALLLLEMTTCAQSLPCTTMRAPLSLKKRHCPLARAAPCSPSPWGKRVPRGSGRGFLWKNQGLQHRLVQLNQSSEQEYLSAWLQTLLQRMLLASLQWLGVLFIYNAWIFV